MEPIKQKIIDFISHLDKREKYLLCSTVIVICIIIFYHLISTFIFGKIDSLEKKLNIKTDQLKEMIILRQEYEAINNRGNSSVSFLNKRDRAFTLFSFLDKNAELSGIKNKIVYMKPSVIKQDNKKYKIATVEMKLAMVSMNQLVNYLYKIESSENNIVIKRLSIIKKENKQKSIDVVLKVETLTL